MTDVVYLIRHPDKESEHATARITESGRTQVRHLIPRLKELHPQIIFSSNLVRSIELAKEIACELAMPMQARQIFNEIPKPPCVTGLSRNDEYADRMEAWSESFDAGTLEPGEGYFTRAELEERFSKVFAAFDDVPYESMAVVGHAHSIAACVQWALLGSLCGFYKFDAALKLNTASITTLIREADRRRPGTARWKVLEVNNTTHLDQGVNADLLHTLSRLDRPPFHH